MSTAKYLRLRKYYGKKNGSIDIVERTRKSVVRLHLLIITGNVYR